MLGLLVPLLALLTAVALLVSGSGLLGTLLAVRGSLEGFSDSTLGLIVSGYFAGFVLGTYTGPPLIRRVGHIRAFAMSAAAASCAVLLHAISSEPIVWAALRVLTGVALVTLYTIIESWLNARAPEAHRGQVFAVYMGVNLLALAAGQQLLLLAPASSFELFTVVALLTCAALIPVAWTTLPQPLISDAQPYRLRRLWREAPSAAAGALLSGMAMGAYWGLAPLFAARIGMDDSAIANFMSVSIIGGAALQWPLGRWSDRADRRRVLAIVSLAAAAVALLMVIVSSSAVPRLLTIFAYGALAFALYPITVAHLMDRLSASEMLGASSTFLLVYGTGAALGPALAGVAMDHFGATALFVMFALAEGLLALFVFWRIAHRDSSVENPGHFMAMVRTTPAALELVPEVEEDEDKNAAAG